MMPAWARMLLAAEIVAVLLSFAYLGLSTEWQFRDVDRYSKTPHQTITVLNECPWVTWKEEKPQSITQQFVDEQPVFPRYHLKATGQDGDVRPITLETDERHLTVEFQSIRPSAQAGLVEYFHGFRKPYLWFEDTPEDTPFTKAVVHLSKSCEHLP